MKRSAFVIAIVAACGNSGSKPAPKVDRPATQLLLEHLPATTDAVVGGSLKDLANWPLWRRAVAVVAYESPGIGEQFVTRCSLDPWTIVDSAAIAFTPELDSTLVAAETSVDRTKLHACVAQVGTLTVEESGKLTKYVQTEGTEVAAWTSERLVLALPEKMDQPEALDAALPVQPVPASLQPLLARVDRSAMAWGVAQTTGDGFVAELLSSIPLKTRPTGAYATVRRDKGLHLVVALVFPDATSATSAADLFSQVLQSPPPPVRPWKDAIRISTNNDETRVTFDLDEARAKQLDDSIIGMLPPPPPPPTREGSAAPPP